MSRSNETPTMRVERRRRGEQNRQWAKERRELIAQGEHIPEVAKRVAELDALMEEYWAWIDANTYDPSKPTT